MVILMTSISLAREVQQVKSPSVDGTYLHNSAIVILRKGSYDKYIKAVLKHRILSETVKESGNISYKLNVVSSRVVTFDEIWNNQAALDAHLGTSHMQSFFKEIGFDAGATNSIYSVSLPTKQGDSLVFTVKPGSKNYVIEKLILNGFTFNNN